MMSNKLTRTHLRKLISEEIETILDAENVEDVEAIEDADDVRVANAAQGHGLALHTLPSVRVAEQLGVEHLEGHRAVCEACIKGPIHRAHPAFVQLRLNPIAPIAHDGARGQAGSTEQPTLSAR